MNRTAFALALFAIFFCFLSSGALSADKIPVFVSIVPQKYFIEQIGAERVNVQVMVQPGASPTTYEPKPSQMIGISKAKIYFAVGVPFENTWLNKFAKSNPAMLIVHTDQGIQKIPLPAHHDHSTKVHLREGTDHSGGHDQGPAFGKDLNSHALEPDPHIWLSPPLAMVQAETMLKALQTFDPPNHLEYETNYRTLVSEITALDTELKNLFADSQELQFMVFHPSWGYFARAYGLNQIAAEIEGKAPKPAQLKELIARAIADEIKVIFVQPQFSTKSAGLIAREIRGQVVFADPLAENWAENLRNVAQQIKVQSKKGSRK